MTKRAHLLNLTLSASPHAPEASDAHLNGHCQYLTELDIIGGSNHQYLRLTPRYRGATPTTPTFQHLA